MVELDLNLPPEIIAKIMPFVSHPAADAIRESVKQVNKDLAFLEENGLSTPDPGNVAFPAYEWYFHRYFHVQITQDVLERYQRLRLNHSTQAGVPLADPSRCEYSKCHLYHLVSSVKAPLPPRCPCATCSAAPSCRR